MREFQKIVWKYYKKYGRHTLPWRKTRDPYRILVSEIMLQQTQVDRVIPKHKEFLKRFPSFRVLANAKTADVIRTWQGLGYNRRALNLKKAAEVVCKKYGEKLPHDHDVLISLPGVGSYTAGALLAFIWNEPMVFIETNIRTVFIRHFFQKKKNVSDADIENKIIETLDEKNPREWYWALMDYGAHLKKTVGNQNTRSRQYTKQPKFAGSNRQLRGAIISLLAKKSISEKEIIVRTKRKTTDVQRALSALSSEGFVKKCGVKFSLA